MNGLNPTSLMSFNRKSFYHISHQGPAKTKKGIFMNSKKEFSREEIKKKFRYIECGEIIVDGKDTVKFIENENNSLCIYFYYNGHASYAGKTSNLTTRHSQRIRDIKKYQKIEESEEITKESKFYDEILESDAPFYYGVVEIINYPHEVIKNNQQNDYLKERENYWMDRFGSYDKGFNKNRSAGGYSIRLRCNFSLHENIVFAKSCCEFRIVNGKWPNTLLLKKDIKYLSDQEKIERNLARHMQRFRIGFRNNSSYIEELNNFVINEYGFDDFLVPVNGIHRLYYNLQKLCTEIQNKGFDSISNFYRKKLHLLRSYKNRNTKKFDKLRVKFEKLNHKYPNVREDLLIYESNNTFEELTSTIDDYMSCAGTTKIYCRSELGRKRLDVLFGIRYKRTGYEKVYEYGIQKYGEDFEKKFMQTRDRKVLLEQNIQKLLDCAIFIMQNLHRPKRKSRAKKSGNTHYKSEWGMANWLGQKECIAYNLRNCKNIKRKCNIVVALEWHIENDPRFQPYRDFRDQHKNPEFDLFRKTIREKNLGFNVVIDISKSNWKHQIDESWIRGNADFYKNNQKFSSSQSSNKDEKRLGYYRVKVANQNLKGAYNFYNRAVEIFIKEYKFNPTVVDEFFATEEGNQNQKVRQLIPFAKKNEKPKHHNLEYEIWARLSRSEKLWKSDPAKYKRKLFNSSIIILQKEGINIDKFFAFEYEKNMNDVWNNRLVEICEFYVINGFIPDKNSTDPRQSKLGQYLNKIRLSWSLKNDEKTRIEKGYVRSREDWQTIAKSYGCESILYQIGKLFYYQFSIEEMFDWMKNYNNNNLPMHQQSKFVLRQNTVWQNLNSTYYNILNTLRSKKTKLKFDLSEIEIICSKNGYPDIL